MGKKGCQVFIGGLSPETSAEDLRKLLADIGGIVYATVWRDGESGQSRGAGKVEFETSQLAQKAVELLRLPSASSSIAFATVFTDNDTGRVDIQFDKAVDWLISRSKVHSSWRTMLNSIYAKVDVAQDAALVSKAAKASDLDYFKIKDLCDAADDKTAWKEAIGLYEKGNVHMAETANSITKMVRFDIPSAKHHAQSCQKQAEDVDRRRKDLTARENEAKRKLKDMCDSNHISGTNIETELRSYADKALPACVEKAVGLIKSGCPEPLRFYQDFSSSLLGGGGNAADSLPLLHFVAAEGNALLQAAADLSAELKAEWKSVQDSAEDPASIKMFANTRARGLVVDELGELECFLAERCFELEEIEKGSLQQNANVKLLFNLEQTRAFHKSVASALDALSGKDVQALFAMSGSETALKNAGFELSAQKALSENPSKEYAALDERKHTLSAEADSHKKEVARLQQLVKERKQWLEEEIGRIMKYKVFLVGSISDI